MLVSGTKKSVLSIINGGGKWVEISIEADPIYQTILIAAEKPSGARLGPAASRDRHPEDQEPPVSGDTKQVEEAFALQGVSSEALAAEEPAQPTQVSPQPPLASTDVVKRPRGRHRRVKAPIDLTEAPPIPSASAIAENPAPPSTHLHTDAAPTKIQKSELAISEPRRHRDKAHLKFVASQPCLVCGRSPADAHHLRFT
jgi:hypothetical protein